MPEEFLDEGSDDVKYNPHYDHLPTRRRSRRTRLMYQCTNTLKSLTDTAYLLKDCEYLEGLNSTLHDVLLEATLFSHGMRRSASTANTQKTKGHKANCRKHTGANHCTTTEKKEEASVLWQVWLNGRQDEGVIAGEDGGIIYKWL